MITFTADMAMSVQNFEQFAEMAKQVILLRARKHLAGL